MALSAAQTEATQRRDRHLSQTRYDRRWIMLQLGYMLHTTIPNHLQERMSSETHHHSLTADQNSTYLPRPKALAETQNVLAFDIT